jgi:toxin ParE1/3/4
MKVRWTLLAERRLIEIEDHVARDDPFAAARLVDNLVARGDSLDKHPMRGRRVKEAPGSGIRELVEGKYRIIYRIVGKTVEVLTVFEGHRQFRAREIDDLE